MAHTFVEVWEQVSSLLGELDVLAGFADLAVSAPTPYARPDMLGADEGEISLVGCRHPCVEAQVGLEVGGGGMCECCEYVQHVGCAIFPLHHRGDYNVTLLPQCGWVQVWLRR